MLQASEWTIYDYIPELWSIKEIIAIVGKQINKAFIRFYTCTRTKI